MDLGTVFLCLFIIAGVVAVSVVVFFRLRDMKRTYDSEINQIVTGVNVGMSNAAAYDKQQQDDIVGLKTSLSNATVTWDSNLNAYKTAMTQSIDTKTFKASVIYTADGLIVGPSNNTPITYSSNSGLIVPMSMQINGAAVIGGSSNKLVESAGADGSRYGVAAPAAGQVKFYGPDRVSGASVAMGFARADGTYDDVITASKTAIGGLEANIAARTMIGGMNGNKGIEIDGVFGAIMSDKSLMIGTQDKLEMGATNGVAVKQGDFVVDSGKLCIQTSCLDKETMDKLIASANAPATPPPIAP